jgi:hypothetical protein
MQHPSETQPTTVALPAGAFAWNACKCVLVPHLVLVCQPDHLEQLLWACIWQLASVPVTAKVEKCKTKKSSKGS